MINQTQKLVLKKKTILELNKQQLYTIKGGTLSMSLDQTGSRTPTSNFCAGALPPTHI